MINIQSMKFECLTVFVDCPGSLSPSVPPSQPTRPAPESGVADVQGAPAVLRAPRPRRHRGAAPGRDRPLVTQGLHLEGNAGPAVRLLLRPGNRRLNFLPASPLGQ